MIFVLCQLISIYLKFRVKTQMSFISQVIEHQIKKKIQNCAKEDFLDRSQSTEIEQIYFCTCGKYYKSFAAIYLHFRTKHDTKLSSKPEETERTMEQHGKVRKYTFDYLKIAENFEEEKDPFSNHRTKVGFHHSCRKNMQKSKIHEYLSTYIQQNPGQDKELYINLEKYIDGPAREPQICQNQQVKAESIPLFFNTFMTQYLPLEMPRVKIHSLKWKNACLSLVKFSRWMNIKQISPLIVIYDLQ